MNASGLRDWRCTRQAAGASPAVAVRSISCVAMFEPWRAFSASCAAERSEELKPPASTLVPPQPASATPHPGSAPGAGNAAGRRWPAGLVGTIVVHSRPRARRTASPSCSPGRPRRAAGQVSCCSGRPDRRGCSRAPASPRRRGRLSDRPTWALATNVITTLPPSDLHRHVGGFRLIPVQEDAGIQRDRLELVAPEAARSGGHAMPARAPDQLDDVDTRRRVPLERVDVADPGDVRRSSACIGDHSPAQPRGAPADPAPAGSSNRGQRSSRSQVPERRHERLGNRDRRVRPRRRQGRLATAATHSEPDGDPDDHRHDEDASDRKLHASIEERRASRHPS